MFDSVDKKALTELRKQLVLAPEPDTVEEYRSRAIQLAKLANGVNDRSEVRLILAQHYRMFSMWQQAHDIVDAVLSECSPRTNLHNRALFNKSQTHHSQCNYNEARLILELLSNSDLSSQPSLRARVAGALANSYDRLGLRCSAEEQFLEAIRYRQGLNDDAGLATVYYNYAEFLHRGEIDDVALLYYERAAAIEKRLGYTANMYMSLAHIAVLYASLNRVQAANDICNDILVYIETVPHSAATAMMLCSVAEVYRFLGKTKAEELTLERAIEISTRLGAKNILASALVSKAQLFRIANKLSLALHFAQEAALLCEQIKETFTLSEAHYEAGIVLLELKHPLDASIAFRLALKGFTTHGQIRKNGFDCLTLLARAETERGNAAEGLREVTSWMHKMVSAMHQQSQQRNSDLLAVNRRLENSNAGLRESATEKDELVSLAIHDLRAPIDNAIAIIDHLHAHVDVQRSSDIQELLSDLHKSMEQMSRTVYVMLNDVKPGIKGANQSLQGIDCTSIVDMISERYESRAASKDIVIGTYCQTNIFVQGDQQIIESILDNLVSNALKFSPLGSTIILETLVDDTFGVFRVVDEGQGLSDEDQSKLFKKYSRLSSQPTAGESSLGLGLYLSQRMANRMGGSISYENGSIRGSVFSLRLPLYRT